ncbi:hypothetical protein QZH41_001022 [Actinostola sp. cb2023]|nr:hypothetical protein QZH41_001022 [Actinostola sp. cb2023]
MASRSNTKHQFRHYTEYRRQTFRDVGYIPSFIEDRLYNRIFVESSKTDQLREGTWVTIARSDLVTCPVKTLELYIGAADINLDDDLPSVYFERFLRLPRLPNFANKASVIRESGSLSGTPLKTLQTFPL